MNHFMVTEPTVHKNKRGREGAYCPFGVNKIFMLGFEIEASKPPQNDLKTCQRHKNDLSI